MYYTQRKRVFHVAGGIAAYQETLGSAVQSALDILGPQRSTAGSQQQEVVMSIRDSGDDSSPPCSSPEGSSEHDFDPLLDFTHESSDFCVPNAHPHSSAALLENVIRAQQALKEMCNLSSSLTREGEVPSEATREGTQARLVSTEASMMVSMDERTGAGRQKVDNLPTSVPPPASSHAGPVHPATEPPPQAPVEALARDNQSSAESPHERADGNVGAISLPPPVPPYQPTTPDNFLLSNKPEYQLEFKKKRHLYEEVELPSPNGTELPPSLQAKMKSRIRAREAAAGVSASQHPRPEGRESGQGGGRGAVDPVRASKGLPASGTICVWGMYVCLCVSKCVCVAAKICWKHILV